MTSGVARATLVTEPVRPDGNGGLHGRQRRRRYRDHRFSLRPRAVPSTPATPVHDSVRSAVRSGESAASIADIGVSDSSSAPSARTARSPPSQHVRDSTLDSWRAGHFVGLVNSAQSPSRRSTSCRAPPAVPPAPPARKLLLAENRQHERHPPSEHGISRPARKGSESMTIRKKALGLTAVAVAAALALTACSSTGGKDAADAAAAAAAGTGAPAGGGGAVADTPRFTIAMVTHEAPGDSFWDKVRAGAQVAAAKDNIDLKYSNDPTGPGEATLVQNAVDSKVDGIAVTLLSPGHDEGLHGRGEGSGNSGRRASTPASSSTRTSAPSCTTARTRTSPARRSARRSPRWAPSTRCASSRNRARSRWRPAVPV